MRAGEQADGGRELPKEEFDTLLARCGRTDGHIATPRGNAASGPAGGPGSPQEHRIASHRVASHPLGTSLEQ